MKKDIEQDWLPHCITCDGRHDPKKESCEDFLARLRAKQIKTEAA